MPLADSEQQRLAELVVKLDRRFASDVFDVLLERAGLPTDHRATTTAEHRQALEHLLEELPPNLDVELIEFAIRLGRLMEVTPGLR